jgi:hypothetical protein
LSQAANVSARALEQRLNRVGWMLLARQAARALPHAALGASAGIICAMLLLVLLPALLFGSAFLSAPAALIGFGAAGAALGFAWRMRHVRKPAAREAALAMESRIPAPTASLATALEAGGDFAAPVLQRAVQELETALAARGPQLYSNRVLLIVPVAILAAALVSALAWDAATVASTASLPRNAASADGGLSAVDTGSGRDSDDAGARSRATGMRKAAAALQTAATVLREPDASKQEIQDALTEAKGAVDQLPAGARPSLSIPAGDAVPATERAALAATLESAAGGLVEAADKTAAAGSGNAGGAGTQTPGEARAFVAFPAITEPAGAAAGDYTTGQSAARRALVQRALEAAK